MEFPTDQLENFEAAVVAAERILLLTHKNPDGDALGALLSLYLVLKNLGKAVVAASIDPIPESYRFLPASSEVVADFSASDFDLVIVLDCGDPHQTGFLQSKPEIFDGSRFLIKIDHHPMASRFGNLELVHPDTCATCFILLHLYEQLKIKIRPDVATCLITGISTDTGSFHHSNTSPAALRSAATLLRQGANLLTASKNVYRTTPISTLKLWGRVLNTLKQNREGVTLAVAQKKDFEITGAKTEALAGVVDYVNAVPDAKFSILLSERDGMVKASLRTQRDDVNTAKIAAAFGGGGHVKAAGFAVPGHLEQEVRWSVLPAENN